MTRARRYTRPHKPHYYTTEETALDSQYERELAARERLEDSDIREADMIADYINHHHNEEGE